MEEIKKLLEEALLKISIEKGKVAFLEEENKVLKKQRNEANRRLIELQNKFDEANGRIAELLPYEQGAER